MQHTDDNDEIILLMLPELPKTVDQCSEEFAEFVHCELKLKLNTLILSQSSARLDRTSC
jgi:hypothetical protein